MKNIKENFVKKWMKYVKNARIQKSLSTKCRASPLIPLGDILCPTSVCKWVNVAKGGGKWWHALPGLGRASAHFCRHLKTRFKQNFRLKYALKCVLFVKTLQKSPQHLAPALVAPPQTPALILPLTITTLSRIFTPIFYFNLCRFCWRERKNISCSRAQGTLATPLAVKKTNH